MKSGEPTTAYRSSNIREAYLRPRRVPHWLKVKVMLESETHIIFAAHPIPGAAWEWKHVCEL